MRFIIERGGLKIEVISDSEKNDIKGLADFFALTDPQAPQMAEQIISDLECGKFQYPTLIQFSKWCNTGVRYVKPQERSRDISIYLFNRVIPRLCDKSDQILVEHIEKLKQFLLKLRNDGKVQDFDSNLLDNLF